MLSKIKQAILSREMYFTDYQNLLDQLHLAEDGLAEAAGLSTRRGSRLHRDDTDELIYLLNDLRRLIFKVRVVYMGEENE